MPEALNIGNVNPLRYRGYYWDKEFGLYYLQTRYYDPSLGRFISPDSVDYLDPESIMGLNLYAYCADNPVMYQDPSGHFAVSTFLISICIGAVISTLAELASDAIDDGKINREAKYYIGAFISGGIAGMGGANVIASIVLSGVGDVVSGAFITQEIRSFDEALSTFVISSAFSALSFGTGVMIQQFAGKKIYSNIVGETVGNININKKLANAGYINLKIGKLGKQGVIEGIINNTKYLKKLDEIVANILDFVISVFA